MAIAQAKDRPADAMEARTDDEGGDDGVDVELVEQVVGKEMRERYEWLKEKRRVENGQFTQTSRLLLEAQG